MAKPDYVDIRLITYQAKTAEDDWTGLKDAAERRKRQNRLNVRAYREWNRRPLHIGLC
jgi:hypothetical protein